MAQNNGKNFEQNSVATPGWLMWAIIAAMIVGALVGGFFPQAGVHLKVLGELFINALMMIVVPLVMLSMITGITGLGDVRKLGSLGWHTILFYAATTGLSVFLGLVLVNLVNPGSGISHGESLPGARYEISGDHVTIEGALSRKGYDGRYVAILQDQGLSAPIETESDGNVRVGAWVNADGEEVEPEAEGTGIEIALPMSDRLKDKPRTVGVVLLEVLRGLIPRNLFEAMAETKVLPLIVFSLLLGAVLTTLGPKGEPAIRVAESLNSAVMEIVHLVMKVAPIGILGLIAGRIGDAGGFAGFMPELIGVAKYFGTVVSGLAIHGIIILPLALRVFGKYGPLRYARNMSTALLNAFCTASSAATIPLTIQGVEERNGISNRTAGFVIPLGATINMDGTALYEAVAAMFIAQVYGVEMGFAAMVIIFLTATLASIGAAGIPEAGLVTMLIVLTAVNLPAEGVTLILVVDWLLDRFRTTVNVWGDAVGSAVVDTWEARVA